MLQELLFLILQIVLCNMAVLNIHEWNQHDYWPAATLSKFGYVLRTLHYFSGINVFLVVNCSRDGSVKSEQSFQQLEYITLTFNCRTKHKYILVISNDSKTSQMCDFAMYNNILNTPLSITDTKLQNVGCSIGPRWGRLIFRSLCLRHCSKLSFKLHKLKKFQPVL